jgi:hypothetical protein
VNSTTDRIGERNAASKIESEAKVQNPVAFPQMRSAYRSWQYYCNFTSVPGVFSYDAEGDADFAVREFCRIGLIWMRRGWWPIV